MKRWLAALALLLSAPAAQAAPLSSGTLALDLRYSGVFSFPATSIVGNAVDPAQVQIAAGAGFAGTVTRPNAQLNIGSVRMVAGSHASGTWTGTPLAGSVAFQVDAVLVGASPFTLGTLPLLVGASFQTTVPIGYTGPPFPAVVTGGPWTTGQAVITGLSPYTGFFTQTQRTGTNQLTAGGMGQVSLVAPMKISVAAYGYSMPLFGTLTLVAAPEPGRVLLLLWGALWLGAVGWTRRRRS